MGPATIAGGMVLFGDAAGWIEAVSITDGKRVWKTLVGPGTRYQVTQAQIEGSHPIPSSVTVLDGKGVCLCWVSQSFRRRFSLGRT